MIVKRFNRYFNLRPNPSLVGTQMVSLVRNNDELKRSGGRRVLSRCLFLDASELYALLRTNTGLEWVFHFGHLGNEVGGFNQFLWCVAARDHNV